MRTYRRTREYAEAASAHAALGFLVTNILDSLAEGASRDDILRSCPTLSTEHIEAALAYAAELAHEESLLPLVG